MLLTFIMKSAKVKSISITLDKNLASFAKEEADKDGRSFSSYCWNLVRKEKFRLEEKNRNLNSSEKEVGAE